MKPTNIWVSWRLTPSNKWKWKTKLKKNISGELENYLRQNSLAETLSKEQIPGVYPSLDILDTFWSGPEMNLNKWAKELENLWLCISITSQRWRWQTICIKKRMRKRTCQHWRQRWRIDTTTRRLHRKTRRRTDYSHQKRYWQHDGQQSDNNLETKMGRKTTLWAF